MEGKLNTQEAEEHVQRKLRMHQTLIWWWSCEHTTWLPFPSLHTELFQNTVFSAASLLVVSGRMCKIFHHFSEGWSTWNTAQCNERCRVNLGGWAHQHWAGVPCTAFLCLQPAQLWAQAHTPHSQRGVQLRHCCWAAKPTWELRPCPNSVMVNLTWTHGV